jgi:diketogulonate reductase-like aldo/keto reductase
VIPKSVRPERLAENMASLYLELPNAAMQQLASLECNQRLIKGDIFTFDAGPHSQS